MPILHSKWSLISIQHWIVDQTMIILEKIIFNDPDICNPIRVIWSYFLSLCLPLGMKKEIFKICHIVVVHCTKKLIEIEIFPFLKSGHSPDILDKPL